MKEFENINTNLPYREGDSYVEALVEKSKSVAEWQVLKTRNTHRTVWLSLAGVAAAAALILALVIPSHKDTVSPIDSFLASISDDEAAMITDWHIEVIPEYY